MTTYRFAVNVLPRDGILDPQGRAVEQSLGHLDLGTSQVSGVRVGRRIELTLDAGTDEEARTTVERLAEDLFSNPLIEQASVELLGATSSVLASR